MRLAYSGYTVSFGDHFPREGISIFRLFTNRCRGHQLLIATGQTIDTLDEPTVEFDTHFQDFTQVTQELTADIRRDVSTQ